MSVKYMDIKEFRAKGYLQEANRLFFHPLGLALEVVINEDGSEQLGGIWDYREDPEGIYFDLKNKPKAVIKQFEEKAKFIEEERNKRSDERKKLFNNIIEPIE